MTQPRDFYTQQISSLQSQLKISKQKLATSSILRLLTFSLIIAGLYFGYPNSQIIIGSIIGGGILFLLLISRHSNLSYTKRKTQKLIDLNQLEIDVMDGKKDHLDSGKEFIDPLHPYGQDIDLFGDRSFFQYINRTATQAGKQKLADFLGSNNTKNIIGKQEAIKNLATLTTWRQEFSAIASLATTTTSITQIQKWLHNYNPFTPKFARYLPKVVATISISLLVLLFLDMIPFSLIVMWLFIGLGITGIYLKKINELYNHAGKAKDTFEQYYKLIERIEDTKFTAPLLLKKQKEILNDTKKTSAILKELASILNAFDQRNNMIFGILGNGYLLWDFHQCYRIEQWINENQSKIDTWFEVIAFFDAINSLANFAFNNSDYIYPTITEKDVLLKATQLGHPMLDPKKRVDNDILIDSEQFFIITGANMAGKSTFLRTVSLQIIMSNAGLPICAQTCEYKPTKLYTSMRTADSLSDDASYFFSELTQLKRIVDALKKDEYFIILDEILKGTNSKDKAEGSRKFVEKLVKANATGIIATHDLSLCEISNEIPVVKNRYFDAQIMNDELYFDYTFKEGICQNMNASFLLKKMEII